MHLTFRNVNDAFNGLVTLFANGSAVTPSLARSTSRVGDVLYIQEPVTITYTHPRERVLFNQARDCNPFFHMYEALWMLAGRRDIAGPAYYTKNYRNCVQDGDNPYANGAYGYRWRHASPALASVESYYDKREGTIMGGLVNWPNDIDQLKLIVSQLKAKPDSRRAVLQMWNVEDDLLKIDTSKDVCCNTHAYFALREGGHCGYCYDGSPSSRRHSDPDSAGCKTKYLDMTVCNRSNDLIWGALGANVVHFSMLQEYLAACIGCEVGVYNQFTNNLHVYTNRFESEKWLSDLSADRYVWESQGRKPLHTVPLVKDPATFDHECTEFAERHGKDAMYGDYQEPFLRDVAQPMCLAFHAYKNGKRTDAVTMCVGIEADDWRIASRNWLFKRQ